MNRIDRVSAILVQLQSRSLVKAYQIAERFDISLRTVYRDIRALEEAGIPIVGNPGVGYSLVDGFKLSPLMFTQAEAIAFLTAEKLVNELTDTGNSEHYQSGMDKIRAVMRFADKDALENVESNMDILKTHKSQAGDMLQWILQSIARKNVLHISYFTNSRHESSERQIEPVGIFFSRINWYLIAYCRTRKAYRTFRVDRIEQITELNEHFRTQHPSLKSFLEDIHQTQELDEIVIRVRKDKASLMGDDKYFHGLVSEKITEKFVECTFLVYSLERFARWYLSFADMATIIKPKKVLTEKIREIIGGIKL